MMPSGPIAGFPAIGQQPNRRLTNNFVVLRVSSDPEPQQAIRDADRQSAVMQAYSSGPVFINLLKVNRWIVRIGLQQLERTISRPLRIGR
jgi:hypothetical protein